MFVEHADVVVVVCNVLYVHAGGAGVDKGPCFECSVEGVNVHVVR